MASPVLRVLATALLAQGDGGMSAHNEVRELLTMASTYDAQAREVRRAAGRVLARLRADVPGDQWHRALRELGIDERTAEILIRMASGSEAP